MVTPAEAPPVDDGAATVDSTGAIVPSSTGGSWSDNYTERPFGGDGRSGNQWEDWGAVMTQAIAPPLGCIEDVLRRTPIDDDLDKVEVAALWPLMIDQITCPAGRYNLELRLLRNEIQTITEVLSSPGTKNLDEDDPLDLNPADWAGYGNSFYRLPVTIKECEERLDTIRNKMRDLEGQIDIAKAGGVYYDVCDLLDWFATPPDRRSTSSPSHVLPFFGQILFGILGLGAQNTQWAHIEAVTSRQIAPRFGGDYTENEKTRFRERHPRHGPGAFGSRLDRAQIAIRNLARSCLQSLKWSFTESTISATGASPCASGTSDTRAWRRKREHSGAGRATTSASS